MSGVDTIAENGHTKVCVKWSCGVWARTDSAIAIGIENTTTVVISVEGIMTTENVV